MAEIPTLGDLKDRTAGIVNGLTRFVSEAKSFSRPPRCLVCRQRGVADVRAHGTHDSCDCVCCLLQTDV